MSMQRKLNALLFELQTAQSPLAQAKILARSWRTVRDLSPTDRRLLARHVSFEGAEQILEGLATKHRGFAPAALLQMLNNARATDGASVSNLLSAIGDPSRRTEAVAMGADLAADLLREPGDDDDPAEIATALEEPPSVQPAPEESPEDEVLAALSALEDVAPETGDEDGDDLEREASDAVTPEPAPLEFPGEEEPTTKFPPRPAPSKPALKVAPLDGWSRFSVSADPLRPGPAPQPPPVAEIPTPGHSPFDAAAVLGALGAEDSSFSRLRVLHREIEAFRGSSVETLRELLDDFREGWARRRALVALIAAGIPAMPSQALELITDLEREVDRRWCLGAMASRGDLRGSILEQSLDLVSTPSARRRLENAARSS